MSNKIVPLNWHDHEQSLVRRAKPSWEEWEQRRRRIDVARGVRLACDEILATPKKNPYVVARELIAEVRDRDNLPAWVRAYGENLEFDWDVL